MSTIKTEKVRVAKRITKNTFTLMAGRAIELISGILLISIVARYLGLSLYGKYGFITSIVSVAIIFSYFGLQDILIREIAKDKDKVGLFLGTTLIIRTALCLLVFFAVVVIAHLAHLSPLEHMAIQLFALSEILYSFSMLLKAVFNAIEKTIYDALFTIINRLGNLLLIGIVVWFDAGFIGLFWAVVVSNLISLIITGIFLVFKLKIIPIIRFDIDQLKYFTFQSLPLGIGRVLQVCSFKVDIFILKIFSSSKDIALFFGPHNIIMRFQLIPLSISIALFPLLTRLSRDSEAAFRHTFLQCLKYTLLIGILVTITTFFWAKEIVFLFFGTEFIQGPLVLKILAFTIGFLFLDALLSMVLIIRNRQCAVTIVSGATLLTNLILDLMLVPSHSYIGAAIATAVSYFLKFILSCFFVNKYVFKLYLTRMIIKPLIAGGLMLGMLFGLGHIHPICSYTVSTIVFVSFLLFFNCFEKQEIDTVKVMISGSLAKKGILK